VLTSDLNLAHGCLHRVDVGSVANVSEVHPDFIFKVDPEDETACAFKSSAALSTSSRCKHRKVELTSSPVFECADCCKGSSWEFKI
jgi:hypothetical protein